MSTTPTVGRRVWYWPYDIERNVDLGDESALPQPFDAGIAHVNKDGTINVSIVNDLGYPMTPRQKVTLYATPAAARPGHCSWMPYQTAQAEKEAAAQAVDKVQAGASASAS